MIILPEEHSLINGLKRGEYESYKILFSSLYSPFVNMVNKIIRDKSAAEDLVQEQFIKIWKNRAKLDASMSIFNYLYVLTKRALFNYLRDKKITEDFEHLSNNCVSNMDIEAEVILNEKVNILNSRINKMPKQRKKVFIMSRMEGLSNEEISNILGLSKRTVENHISLALKELRNLMS